MCQERVRAWRNDGCWRFGNCYWQGLCKPYICFKYKQKKGYRFISFYHQIFEIYWQNSKISKVHIRMCKVAPVLNRLQISRILMVCFCDGLFLESGDIVNTGGIQVDTGKDKLIPPRFLDHVRCISFTAILTIFTSTLFDINLKFWNKTFLRYTSFHRNGFTLRTRQEHSITRKN